MKLKVGDTVLVTAGKDKGKTAKVLKVVRDKEKVVVEGVNLYTRHFKPMNGQAGRKVRKERPLPTASVAIINDKGERDRIGYSVAKDGSKVRIFKKTGAPVPEPKPVEALKAEK
jgi:large subunit ribosomal protein L24